MRSSSPAKRRRLVRPAPSAVHVLAAPLRAGGALLNPRASTRPSRATWPQRLATVAIAVVASVAVAPSAGASTLTYVKGGQVWVSAPDGSEAHLVTPDGTEWRSPTLADDGTVYAYNH